MANATRGCAGVDVAVVDAHELRRPRDRPRRRVTRVRSRVQSKQQLSRHREDQRGDEDDERQHSRRRGRRATLSCVSRPPPGSERASAEKTSSSTFCIDDRQTEGHEQRWQRVVADVRLSRRRAAARSRRSRHQPAATIRQRTGAARDATVMTIAQNAASTMKIAVGDVDDTHDAEHQRQPEREQRVQAAEQQALDDRVDQPIMLEPPEVGARDRVARSSSPSAREGDAALLEAVQAVRLRCASATSCSTSTTAMPSAAMAGSAS